MLLLDRAVADIIQRCIIALADHRIDGGNGIPLHLCLSAHILDNGVVNLTHIQRVCQRDGRFQRAELRNLHQSCGFAKSIEQDQNTGVVRATALYTASWSLGMATGPFVFGLLPINVSFIINAVFGLVIAGGIVAVSLNVKRGERTVSAEQKTVPGILLCK